MGVGAASLDLSSFAKERALDILSAEMPKRRLGRTGIMVSCLGFGGGSRYAMADERMSERLIDYAIALGVTYFDAARSYGKGVTEERYGRYLTPKYRNRIFLNSKSEAGTYDGVMKDLETSLKTLNTDHLDLYCMHGIDKMEQLDALLSPAGGYKAFRKLKDEGVVKNIGYSFHYWDAVAERAFASLDVDAILCPMNASRNDGNEKNLLPRALKRDVGVIAIKITGQNALIGKVTGGDLVRYALSLPISIANIGMDGLGTLEACAGIAREKAISKAEAEKIHQRLAFDPKVTRLPYYQG